MAPSVIAAGANTRTLTVFNDTFTGTRLDMSWSLRQGAPDGAVVASGSLSPDVAPGDHVPLPILLPLRPQRICCTSTSASRCESQGVLFKDASTVYQVQ